MNFLQAEEDEHLSAPVRRVYFPFSSLSVIAALEHNSLVALHWMDNVSKGFQLAHESKSEASRYEAQEKKEREKFSGRQEPAWLAVEPGWLQTAAEVFN